MKPQSMRWLRHWLGVSIITSTNTLDPFVLDRRSVLVKEWRPLVQQFGASGQINFGLMYRRGRGVATLQAYLGNYI